MELKTFHKNLHNCHRNDYVLVPTDALADVQRSWVDHSIDLGTDAFSDKDGDHRPVLFNVKFVFENDTDAAAHFSRRPLIDKKKMSDPVAVQAFLCDALSSPHLWSLPWWLDVHMHAACSTGS